MIGYVHEREVQARDGKSRTIRELYATVEVTLEFSCEIQRLQQDDVTIRPLESGDSGAVMDILEVGHQAQVSIAQSAVPDELLWRYIEHRDATQGEWWVAQVGDTGG